MVSSNPSRSRSPLVLLIAILSVAGSSSVALAQKAPAAGYAMPAGGKAGTTVEVRLGGYDWTPDVQFLLYDSTAKLEILTPPGNVISHLPPYWFGIKSYANDPPLPREVCARFVLPPDMPDGPLRWCVANASGGGPCGVFIVGHNDEVTEDEQRREPQPLPSLPITVNGRLLRIEEVDRYRFAAQHTGIVTCELTARRLGSDFHGVLEIEDESGGRVAQTMDTEGTDPVLTFHATKGKSYVVAVRDLDYRGFRCMTYRLAVSPGPRVIAAVPSGGRRGEIRTVEFLGIGIATGQNQLETVSRDVAFPTEETQSHFRYKLQTPYGDATELSLAVSDLAEQVEPEPSTEDIRRIVMPCAVTGRLSAQNRKDRYTVTGHKGDHWTVWAETRCLVSSLDLALTVIGPDGKEIAANDDSPGTTDPRLSTVLPADGEYQIVVSDMSGPTDSHRSIYRLVLRPTNCDFRLRTTGIVNLSATAGTGVLEGTVARDGGFQEPIRLSVTGLPEGVTSASDVVVEPSAQAFKIPLSIAAATPVSTSFVQLRGTAQSNGSDVVHAALAPTTGTLVNRDPESSSVSQILMTTTLKAPFKIKPTEADGGRRVNRGATYLAELIVERDTGFTGDILLDMSAAQSRHRQGIHGPPFTIHGEARKVEYPVFVPEILETARTSRIGLIAMTRIPDAKGTERFVLANVEGQITMSIEGALLKLSHTADDFTVTAGQSFVLPLKVARSPALAGIATIELVVPAELDGSIEAEPLTLSANQGEAEWKIQTRSDARLIGDKLLTAKATVMRDGFPVVSECQINVEFAAALGRAVTE